MYIYIYIYNYGKFPYLLKKTVLAAMFSRYVKLPGGILHQQSYIDR